MTLKLNGSSSGSVSIDAPASTTGGADRVITLPDRNQTGLGCILQVKQGTPLTSKFSTASATMVDSGLSVAITPTATTSKILVQVSLGSLANSSAGKRVWMDIVRGSTTVIKGDAATGGEVTACLCTRSADSNHTQVPVSFMYLDSPATTSATTYKVQLAAGPDSGGTVYLNGSADGDSASGNTASTLIVMEVAG